MRGTVITWLNKLNKTKARGTRNAREKSLYVNTDTRVNGGCESDMRVLTVSGIKQLNRLKMSIAILDSFTLTYFDLIQVISQTMDRFDSQTCLLEADNLNINQLKESSNDGKFILIFRKYFIDNKITYIYSITFLWL